MATPQTNDHRHICTSEKCSECQQQPLTDVELQYAEQRRAQCGRHYGAKRKPLISLRLVAACGKGLLLGIAIAFVWRNIGTPPQAPKSGKPSGGEYVTRY